jgi:molybdenum cofactor biosynthesis enzyme MoaA
MENIKGLRIITNTHCNYKCKFCYQKDKSKNILSISNLLSSIEKFNIKNFEYCTIMGGESTLLYNLSDYIKVGSKYSKEVRLTTNGSMINEDNLNEWRDSGLTGINISIASIKKYKEITGGLNIEEIFKKILMTKNVFPDLRINIALCKENYFEEIKEMIDLFVDKMNINVTICEDVLKTFSCVDNFKEKLNSDFVEDTGYGLIFLSYNGKKFGYYTHEDNYKNTDLIISPYGTDIAWDGYCKKVGLNYES